MTHHEHPNVTIVREGFAAVQRGDMAWMDQHLADDVVWHVGGNSKWAGAYQGKAKMLEYFAPPGPVDRWATLSGYPRHPGRQRPRGGAGDGLGDRAGRFQRRVEYTQIFHIRDGKATEVWGMAENDAAVDPFLDGLPD
jgi:hypothetical protein